MYRSKENSVFSFRTQEIGLLSAHRQHMTLTKQFAEEYEDIQEKRTPGPNNFSLMEYRRLPNGPPFQNY